MTAAQRLKQARRRLGMSQLQLALAAGYSPSTIAFYETGRLRPTPKFWARLRSVERGEPRGEDAWRRRIEAEIAGLAARIRLLEEAAGEVRVYDPIRLDDEERTPTARREVARYRP
jgi:transcriptional regulator with XRE-family HTH domain